MKNSIALLSCKGMVNLHYIRKGYLFFALFPLKGGRVSKVYLQNQLAPLAMVVVEEPQFSRLLHSCIAKASF